MAVIKTCRNFSHEANFSHLLPTIHFTSLVTFCRLLFSPVFSLETYWENDWENLDLANILVLGFKTIWAECNEWSKAIAVSNEPVRFMSFFWKMKSCIFKFCTPNIWLLILFEKSLHPILFFEKKLCEKSAPPFFSKKSLRPLCRLSRPGTP